MFIALALFKPIQLIYGAKVQTQVLSCELSALTMAYIWNFILDEVWDF